MGKTIYIDDGDALNIDRVIVNMPNTNWCKVLYSCDLIDDYEARLKADKIAMLEEIQDKIFKESWRLECICDDLDGSAVDLDDINKIIQQKIEQLKGEDKK